jgi:hypothetical protein
MKNESDKTTTFASMKQTITQQEALTPEKQQPALTSQTNKLQLAMMTHGLKEEAKIVFKKDRPLLRGS